MSAKFSIHADHACGLIRITMAGLVTLDDVASFYAERARAHEELGLPKNMHLTLNDVRDLKILPQPTLAAFVEMLADPEYHSRKLAFVVAPTLVRGQVARAIGERPNARCFTEMVDAEEWLLAGEMVQAPPRRAAAGR